MEGIIARPPPDRFAEAERHRLVASSRAMSVSGVMVAVAYVSYALAFDRANLPLAGFLALGMTAGYGILRGSRIRLGVAVCILTIQATVVLLTVRHGADSGVHFGFAVIGLAVLAIFETWTERWCVFAAVMASAALAIAGQLDFLLAEADVDLPYETAFYTLLVMGAAYWLSDDLLRINREFRVRSRAVVDEIGARSAELSKGLAQLGRQSEDLRHANVALAAEVAHGESVQRELRVSREQLEQFVYAASHDLKEPLRSISGFVQLIRRRLGVHGDPDLDAYLEIVLASSSGMTRLLDGLLAYSRTDAQAASPEDVDLSRIALLVRHGLSAYVEERGGRVEVAADLGRAYCARAAFQTILREVVHNALKFARAGESPRVEIGRCRESGGLYVRDYGIGVDEAFRERVFGLFQRLNPVDEYEGAGIGLALARKLADANEIAIAIATPPEGPGTVVLLNCPPPGQPPPA